MKRVAAGIYLTIGGAFLVSTGCAFYTNMAPVLPLWATLPPSAEEGSWYAELTDAITQDSPTYVTTYSSDEVSDEVCHYYFGRSEHAVYKKYAERCAYHARRWNHKVDYIDVCIACDTDNQGLSWTDMCQVSFDIKYKD